MILTICYNENNELSYIATVRQFANRWGKGFFSNREVSKQIMLRIGSIFERDVINNYQLMALQVPLRSLWWLVYYLSTVAVVVKNYHLRWYAKTNNTSWLQHRETCGFTYELVHYPPKSSVELNTRRYTKVRKRRELPLIGFRFVADCKLWASIDWTESRSVPKRGEEFSLVPGGL